MAKYEIDLAGEQDVSCDKCGTEPAYDYIFFYRHENGNHLVWARNHINSYNAAAHLLTDVLYRRDGSSVRAAGLQLLKSF